mgnify:FL=1
MKCKLYTHHKKGEPQEIIVDRMIKIDVYTAEGATSFSKHYFLFLMFIFFSQEIICNFGDIN